MMVAVFVLSRWFCRVSPAHLVRIWCEFDQWVTRENVLTKPLQCLLFIQCRPVWFRFSATAGFMNCLCLQNLSRWLTQSNCPAKSEGVPVCTDLSFSVRRRVFGYAASGIKTTLPCNQGCGAGAGAGAEAGAAGAAGADTFWSEPEPKPEPPKWFAQSRSRSRSRNETGQLRLRKGIQLRKNNWMKANREITNNQTNRLLIFFINNFRTSAIHYLQFSSLPETCIFIIWTSRSRKSFIRLGHATDEKRHRGLIRLRIFKMRWVSVANDHLGPKPLISDSATRRRLWPLQGQPVSLDDNEWQISKTFIQSPVGCLVARPRAVVVLCPFYTCCLLFVCFFFEIYNDGSKWHSNSRPSQ